VIALVARSGINGRGGLKGEQMTGDHELRLFNSLGRRLETFEPSGDVVGMYSCGPTVYAFPHIGNMRAYVFADTLRRALRWKGYQVEHVVNITDVGHAVADTELGDDKLELAAEREQRSVAELAKFYTEAFFADLADLNVLPADEHPRATAYIDEMIELVRGLEARGVTYAIPSGIYFDTSQSPNYGELAMMDLEGQREGARLEHVEGRRNKTDFALWRAEEPGRQRVMRWDSPWGWGAPGWHLECSAMSIALLGPHFDVHTGGIDHRELHHVNEIAQSEAYLGDGKPWVHYWLHNEFLRFNEQKIAKSAGTATRLADLAAAGVHPLAYRLFLLGGHYRAQMDFTTAGVDASQAALRRLLGRVAPLRPLPVVETLAAAEAQIGDDEAARQLLDDLDAAVSSDLNTPQALALLQQALRHDALTDEGRRVVVAASDALLGLRLATLEADELGAGGADALDETERAELEQLVAQRAKARADRDWALADRIRDELAERGVVVTDTADGTEWKVEQTS
jgi:cysteinyl-tRNA synthetase